jgi:hypothetical protein
MQRVVPTSMRVPTHVAINTHNTYARRCAPNTVVTTRPIWMTRNGASPGLRPGPARRASRRTACGGAIAGSPARVAAGSAPRWRLLARPSRPHNPLLATLHSSGSCSASDAPHVCRKAAAAARRRPVCAATRAAPRVRHPNPAHPWPGGTTRIELPLAAARLSLCGSGPAVPRMHSTDTRVATAMSTSARSVGFD